MYNILNILHCDGFERMIFIKKQGFLYGSLILILSAVITKIIGAFFRIPLANMLGGTGMGYFSCAYGIFMPIYAVSVTGLPTAVAKITAENSALELFDNVKKIKRVSLMVFGMAGLFFSVLTASLAYPFCMFLTDNPNALPAVLCIAPSVFFGCITSVYRGYYEGLRNMYPTAVSQVVEGLIKLFAGLGLCYTVLKTASLNPEKFSQIFKVPLESVNDAALPYAAAAAILGVTAGTVAGTVFLIIKDKFSKNIYTKSHEKTCTETSKAIVGNLLRTVLPIAAGSLITNLTSIIDLATIMNTLSDTIKKSPEIFSAYISENIPTAALPNFIFGSFTGLAVTVFNLIPSFTNMFGKGALPTIAEGFAAKDFEKVKKSSLNALFTTSFIAIPSGLGICVLSRQILQLLFPSKPLEAEICVLPMSVLGLGVIFLCISMTIFSVLQAAGKSDIPVKLMLLGVVIKLFGNIILIRIPQINISGAAISTLICYAFIFVPSLVYFIKITKINFSDVKKMLVSISYSAVLCAAAAALTFKLMPNNGNMIISLAACVSAGVIVYIISTHLTGIFTKSTLKTLIS